MQLVEFIRAVVTSPEEGGWFCLSSNGQDGWKNHWYQYPSELNEIVYAAKSLAGHANVYFTAHLFKSQDASKNNVLPTRTIQADLDYADIYSAPIPPTILVETSPGRAQAFWVLKSTQDTLPTEEVERLSRKLTYSIPDCDRTGWPLGHRVRLPDTYNYKYPEPHHITILSAATKRVEPTAFDVLPDLDEDEIEQDEQNSAWIQADHLELDIKPVELINELAKDNKISTRVRAQYNHPSTDRSEALWQLMCELFSAGLGRDLVYWLAHESDNNKFEDRVYGAVRDLRKDVLRAELHVHAKGVDVKSSILEIRKDSQQGTTSERLTKIGKLVINHMRNNGSFYHTRDSRLFYIPRTQGRPIAIPVEASSSEWLSVLMTHEFGINSSLSDARYIIAEIRAHVKNMPALTEVASLSYYDDIAETLLVHGGGKDVFSVSKDTIMSIPNGNADVLFTWSGILEQFRLDMRPLPQNQTWYNLMFKTTMKTATNVTEEQGVALLTVWFMMILFRRAAYSRPILALLGAPGAGKSTALRKVYKLLYGKMRDLHQLTNADDFDIATSSNPLVAYDNADSYERWMPDRFAMATTVSETEKRKLFTDQDTIVLRRDAIVAVTAHSPKFLREDVADRLLVIMFKRRESFDDEVDILGEVTRHRNVLWAHILEDVQRILNTPKPFSGEAPNFRIKDFASIGLWISRGIGLEQQFLSGLEVVKGSQTELVIEEEYALVSTLHGWVRAHPGGDYISSAELFPQLLLHATDPHQFQRTYKNGVQLGKKLFVMCNALRSHFTVDYKADNKTGSRVWQFREKDGN